MRGNIVLGLLILFAVFFALTAGSSLRAPAQFASRLGYELMAPDGFNEIRAQYGGFFLAACVANLLAVFRKVPRSTAFFVNSIVFGGLISGRLMSLWLDAGSGTYGPLIRALFFIDAIGFIVSTAALLHERRTTQQR